MSPFNHIQWAGDHLVLLDQTKLPVEEIFIKISTVEQLAEAIKKLRIRGAPAIGVAAAYGLVIGAKAISTKNLTQFTQKLNQIADYLIETRPTAINLRWAIDRLMQTLTPSDSIDSLIQKLENEAKRIHEEDIALCKCIGVHGADIFSEKRISILTHCNAGALATGGQGTALSVIYELYDRGLELHVYADETRPLLQGTRLTAWELQKTGIPVTVICDNMAAVVLREKKVDCVIVGADRIASNGDTANKIGTFTVAVLAKNFKVPFYVAAPYSTFDLTLDSGDNIPIELRPPDEITRFKGNSLAPAGANVYNPAFDVTPNELITAIITDRGVFYPPFFDNISKLKFKA